MAAGSSQQVNSAVAAFVGDPSQITGIDRLGDGNINDTYLVTARTGPWLVLQRINASVFTNPTGVAANGAVVCRHLNLKIAESGYAAAYRFPETVESLDGPAWHEDRKGDVWRCQTFVANTVSLHYPISTGQAFEAGCLLGLFHRICAGLDHRELCTPLPGFHDLDRYRHAYVEAVRGHHRPPSSDLDYCRAIAEQRLEGGTLDELAAAEGIGSIVIHGDPKCDNFLFDADTDRAVSLVDLDTTAAGLAAVDVGDCLRSFCNPGGETGGGAVSFNIDICRKLIEGYQTKAETTPADNSLIYHGVRLMTYELGLRFFTDYLNRNRYFKVADEEENLRRARVQFRLLESIEAQRSVIESLAGC